MLPPHSLRWSRRTDATVDETVVEVEAEEADDPAQDVLHDRDGRLGATLGGGLVSRSGDVVSRVAWGRLAGLERRQRDWWPVAGTLDEATAGKRNVRFVMLRTGTITLIGNRRKNEPSFS